MQTTQKDIMELLDGKITEIFVEIQNKEGIVNGDIEPIHLLQMENKRDELAQIIYESLVVMKIKEDYLK